MHAVWYDRPGPRPGPPLPLKRAAEAHDRVDAGARERVLLAVPD